MEVLLCELYFGDAYFKIDTKNVTYFTSESISKLFNLDVDLYNKLLIEKVIMHKDYSINDPRLFPSCSKHLSFKLNNTSVETYLNRFKETFASQLTLFSLGEN